MHNTLKQRGKETGMSQVVPGITRTNLKEFPLQLNKQHQQLMTFLKETIITIPYDSKTKDPFFQGYALLSVDNLTN